MPSTPDQPSTPKAPAQHGQPEQREERREAWRPRVVEEHAFNVFESDHQGPDSEPPPMKIQDPSEETTPLEGTRDRSPEDSLEPDYVATEHTKPAQRDRLGSPDRRLNATPGTGKDTPGPKDRTTLGR